MSVFLPVLLGSAASALAALALWLALRLRQAQALARRRDARLRAGLEAIPGAALIYDADERLSYCNAEARRQHDRFGAPATPGATLDQVLGAMARSGLTPDAAGRESEWIAERTAQFRAAGENGEERWIDGRWFQVYFRRLEGGGRLVLRFDVSDAKAREAELAESERRFRALAEVSSDWFWRSDAEHRFLPAAADNRRGIGPGAPGSRRWEIAAPEDLAAEPEKWSLHKADLDAHREFRDFRYWAFDPEGRRVYARTSGRPEFDDAGAFLGYCGVSSDLTAQVEAELSAAAAQARLAEAIEKLPLGIALFDREDRLVVGNSGCRGFFASAAPLMQPGAKRRDILTAAAQGGDIAGWKGRGEAWFAETQRTLARGDPTIEFRLADGRWLTRLERPTSEGGRIVAYADVTELKRQEGELREKSALLRATLDNIGQGLAVFGPDLTLLAWNDYYFAIAGLPPELGRVGTPARAISDALLAAAADGEACDPEERYRAFARLLPARLEIRLKDGRVLEIMRSRMPGGGVVVTASDISEVKRREEELAAKTAQMQIVFENLAEGVSVIDGELKTIAFNSTGLRLLGFPERFPRFEDYIRFNAERGEYGPGDVEQLVAERVALARQFVPHAFERTRPDGTVIEVRGNPVPGGGFVTTYRDVTEQRRVEETLRRAKEQAELASRAKSEFLANTSHELRTPLNAILGFSEILMQQMFGPLGAERYLEYARDIHNSGSHLLSIINDLLDLAKVEAGRFDMQDEPIALREALEGATRFVRDRADAAGVRIALTVEPGAPQLFGDQRALKQIIVNLLSNAVKFTTEGGRVEISARLAADGWLDLVVTDTGIGMTDHDIEVALTPFGQVESALNRRYEGTGLGLPLARRFVELHGGALSIASKPGEGTAVAARFPPERLVWPEPARSVGAD